MKRTSIAVLFLLLLTIAVVAEGFDFEAERAKANIYLANEHADLGKEYAKAGFNVAAREQFERALSLIPEHADAMKGLGNKKVDGHWVMDKALPKEDGAGATKKALDAAEKSREKFYEKGAERLRKLATAAEKAGMFEKANVTWAEVLYYAPNDATACGKLGRKRDSKGIYYAEFIVNGRERGKKILEEASEGTEGGADAQSDGIGAKLYVRRGGPVSARATESDKRAARIHKVGAGANALAHELLEAKTPLISDRQPFTLTTLQKREQYTAMVEKYTDLKGEAKVLALKVIGYDQDKPWGYFVEETHPETAEDMLANTMALMVVFNYRPDGADCAPWMTTGFTYLVTTRLLGSTLTVRYRVEEEEPTMARRASSPNVALDERSPEGLRARVLNAVRLRKDLPLRTLAATDINSMKIDHAAKSLAMFEFLFDRHREQTLKWLALKPLPFAEDLGQLCTALGKTAEEVDEEWRRWVLLNY